MVSGGPLVPGYEDLEVLGRGGFATVYRARQVAFDRLVALKVLDGAHTDERTVQLFTRECRAAGSLSWHPHVVVVFDAGTTDRGTPYLAMELLPGGSLADRLDASGPLPVGDAVRLTGEVASALAAAHESDLLHRDVKPANVLVDRLGRAKLADFGIARLVGAGSATATGAVTGTVAYMAPEVLKGAKASPASDVYSLGLTLLTLLTGRNPLTADSDDSPYVVIARVIAGDPLPIPPGTPAEVRGLIEVCTDHEPGARPTASDVAARCAGLVPPAPGPATPPPTGTPRPPGPPAVVPGRVPPPPASAVRVRPDHTLADAPVPPSAPPDTTVAAATTDGAGPGGGVGGDRSADEGGSNRGPRRTLAIAALVVAGLVIGAAVLALVLGGGDGSAEAGDTTAAAAGGSSSDDADQTTATDEGGGGALGGGTATSEAAQAGDTAPSTTGGGDGDDSTTTAVPGEDRAIGVTPERTAALLVAEEVGSGWEASDDDLDDATLESMRVDQFCSIAPAEALLARRFVDPADDERIDVVQTLIVFPDEAAAEAYLAEDFCVGPSADPVPGLGDEATSYRYGEYEQLTIRVGAVVTEIVGAAAQDLRTDVAPTAAAKLAGL